MSTEQARKGRALEDAVEFIHDAILRTDPKYVGVQFRIESRVWRTVANVRYEIDVLVETLPGTHFPAIWVFECKNWTKPVDRKEVLDLAAKVDALGATRGFLVAKALSQNAVAQLAQNRRLEFIPCKDDFFSLLSSAELTYTSIDPLPAQVTIQWYGIVPQEVPKMLDASQLKCEYQEETIPFLSVTSPLVERIAIEDKDAHPFMTKQEDVHWGDVTKMVPFKPNELVIYSMQVAHLIIRVAYFYHFQRRKIISKFEVGDRGRWFAFEPISRSTAGQVIEVQIMERI